MKRTGLDPLFNINHTLAMFTDNVKRLARQTWCTTKKLSGLEDELAFCTQVHNSQLLPKPMKISADFAGEC